ncbi:MAG: AbrB/MazE/SpoVT family DNA-binding domain-containing protein [Pseudomonadales bacterium]|nr:AbrB/MazE/SpoVT family DNA-binding domain-containing protein [Candidatus Woesebacteria bacterium]MCB9801976.1 AbrB/MazE/SpoVT family DNA-binding domain-containing protein [Pseudomonadales bacterium]
MQMVTTVTTKGQVVIPQHLRDALGLHPSQKVLFDRKGETLVLKKVPTVKTMRGFITAKKKVSARNFDAAIKQAVLIKHHKKQHDNS